MRAICVAVIERVNQIVYICFSSSLICTSIKSKRLGTTVYSTQWVNGLWNTAPKHNIKALSKNTTE